MLLITALEYELSSLNTDHKGEKSLKVEGADKYKEKGRDREDKQLRKKGATDDKEKKWAAATEGKERRSSSFDAITQTLAGTFQVSK